MKSISLILLLFTVILISSTVSGQVETVTLYATKDTYIQASLSGSTYTGNGVNYGTDTTMNTSKTTNGPPITVRTVRRGLVAFDLSSIPYGAVFSSATLRLKKSTSSYSSVSMYASKITATWNETSVTWSDIATSTYSADRVTNSNPGDTTLMEFDVLDHVNDITCAEQNFGWMLMITTESNDTPANKGKLFRTRETNYDPQLILQYYPALNVSYTYTAATGLSATDGALNMTVHGGDGGTYTYSWHDDAKTEISTSQDISGVVPGVYEYEVTDSHGGEFRSYFIVPCTSDPLTITIQPTPDISEDAQLVKTQPSPDNTNYSRNYTGFGTVPGPSWDQSRFFIRYPIELATLADEYVVTDAEMTLTAGPHSSTHAQNKSHMRLVQDPWCERCISWNKQPAVLTLDSLAIPNLTGTTNAVLDVTEYMLHAMASPTYSYGFRYAIDTTIVSPKVAYQVFYASENLPSGSETKAPKLEITIERIPSVFQFTERMDAQVAELRYDVLQCYIPGYSSIDWIFTLFDEENELISTQGDIGASFTVADNGNNYFTLDIDSGLSTGTYLFVATSATGDQFRLKFSKNS